MEKASGTATYATVDNSLLVRKVIVNSGIYQWQFYRYYLYLVFCIRLLVVECTV